MPAGAQTGTPQEFNHSAEWKQPHSLMQLQAHQPQDAPGSTGGISAKTSIYMLMFTRVYRGQHTCSHGPLQAHA